MAVLIDPMRKYILAEDKRGWNKSVYDSRVQKYAIKGLEELTLLANRLPEKQLQEIFSEKTLRNFFEALLKLEIPAEDHEGWKTNKETEDILNKRRRLLKICYTLLMRIGNRQFTAILVHPIGNPGSQVAILPLIT